MITCCNECQERHLHCHETCIKYQKAKFVHGCLKAREQAKLENDMMLGIKSIERHIKWRTRKGY